MEDKEYRVKKEDIEEHGYVIIPASCLKEAPEEPNYKDGDKGEY